MTSVIKPLARSTVDHTSEVQPRKQGPFSYAFTFAFGFWAGSLLFFAVVLPALSCFAWLVLTVLGVGLSSFIPPR